MTRIALILSLAATTLGADAANAQTLPCGTASLSMVSLPCTSSGEARRPPLRTAQATIRAGSSGLVLVRHQGRVDHAPEPTLTAQLVDSPGAPFAF